MDDDTRNALKHLRVYAKVLNLDIVDLRGHVHDVKGIAIVALALSIVALGAAVMALIKAAM